MSNYMRANYGPGDIAALPPTIGLTSRAPTIGAEDPGRPIPKVHGIGQISQSGIHGFGTTGEGNGEGWVLPVGIGIALGGLLALFMTK